jgi:prefoldin subunit 5
MFSIDILRNRFDTLRAKLDDTNKIPEILTNYINNIHDEFAEYDALVYSNGVNTDEAKLRLADQLEYIDLIIVNAEYMIEKMNSTD